MLKTYSYGTERQYIRFDWAIKRLLRNKANFGVLEGFLTVLLGEEIHILEILESEGNQQREEDRIYNCVDIKARNSKDEIVLSKFKILVNSIIWNESCME